MPIVPIVFLAAIVGYTYYSAKKGTRAHPGGPPGPGMRHGHPRGPAGRPAPPVARPMAALPQPPAAAPTWMDPGMPPEYAEAAWQALYYERDPHRLHAFGDRLHEMRMHRAGDAMHRRAESMRTHGHHFGPQSWGA